MGALLLNVLLLLTLLPTSFAVSADDDAMASSTALYESLIAADPALFLYRDAYLVEQYRYTEDQMNHLRYRARTITADCQTAAEKIYAVAMYVARHICYDYDWYDHEKQGYTLDPYNVLAMGFTTCGGYANTTEALLQLSGVPCVSVGSPTHAWNLAYTGDRWMLVDTTFMANGRFEFGVSRPSSRVNTKWFNFSLETAYESPDYHLITGLPLMIKDGVLSAFPLYSRATSYTVPTGVTTIGDKAFASCIGLQTVVLSDDVTTIGDKAFASCTGLQSVTMPDGVTAIGKNAFDGCTALRTVTMPLQLTALGDYAFANCKSLEAVELPEGVTAIPKNLFQNCQNLVSVRMADTVTTIGNWAFAGCDALEELYLSASLRSIGDYAFGGCDLLDHVSLPDGLQSIAAQAFCDCDSLSAITVPDSVTTLGMRAFYGCDELEQVVLGSGVTAVADETFASCRALREITLGAAVLSIGSGAFSGCEALTAFTMPDSVFQLSASAFVNCKKLESITLGAGLIAVLPGTFSGCAALTDIRVSADNAFLTSADGVLFDRAMAQLICYPSGKTVTTYAIPDSVVYVPDSAFHNVSALTAVTLPKGLKSIGMNAFRLCKSLTDIYVPAELDCPLTQVFEPCTALENIHVAPENPRYAAEDGVLFSKDKTQLLRYPTGRQETEYTIPAHVTHIEMRAFANCKKLETISMPRTVKTAGATPFLDCTRLTTIRGYIGSFAELCAKQNQLVFDPLVQLGDASDDGAVDSSDARMILQSSVSKVALSARQQTAADINMDGNVDSRDARIALQIAVNKATI